MSRYNFSNTNFQGADLTVLPDDVLDNWLPPNYARLHNANLHRADFRKANLEEVILNGARCHSASFQHARLGGASLEHTDLYEANLEHANLEGARCHHTVFDWANLSNANLRGASFSYATFNKTDFSGADLTDGEIAESCLHRASFNGTNLDRVWLRDVVFADCDLSVAANLGTIRHGGPSSVTRTTLLRSHGQIPQRFLLGCGLAKWEVEIAKLYGPAVSASDVADIVASIHRSQSQGRQETSRIFISYAHADSSDLALQLYDALQSAGVAVWLDKHELSAGATSKQIIRAVRANDVILLVLSQASVQSDWVNYEISEARAKEKAEGRDVLCPIAVDDSWRQQPDSLALSPVLLKYLVQKYTILDFSEWRTDFDRLYQRLIEGLQSNYDVKTARAVNAK